MRLARIAWLALALGCSQSHGPSTCDGGTCDVGADIDAAPRDDAAPDAPPPPPPRCGHLCEPCCPGSFCFGGVCSGSSCGGGTQCDAGTSSGPDAGDACAEIAALDRSCSRDSDCAFAIHASDCCGSYAAIGFAASQAEEGARLEPLCAASYPSCGCAARPTTTDSGEVVTAPAAVRVACVADIAVYFCETYIAMRPPDTI